MLSLSPQRLHNHGREKLETFLEVSTFSKYRALLTVKVDKISYCIILSKEYAVSKRQLIQAV